MLASICLCIALSAAKPAPASDSPVDDGAAPAAHVVSSRRTRRTQPAPSAASAGQAASPAPAPIPGGGRRSRATDPVQRGERTGISQPSAAGRFQVTGWTEASFTASTDTHQQLPMGFNYRANQFLLQQNWLRLARAAPSTGADRGFGFLSDTILPGSDYRFTLPEGLFGQQLTAHHGQPDLYGIDPVRLFGEAYLPNVGEGTNVKLGRFYAQFGVETIDAPGNSLLSHTYTFIYDPFTQIGLVATTKLNERWTTQVGLTSGSDFFTGPASATSGSGGLFQNPTFIGSLKWVRPGGNDDVKYAVIVGPGRYNRADHAQNVDVFNLVWNHQFNPNLKYTFNQLFGFQRDVPKYGNARWLSFVQYLTRRFNAKVSGALRLEFFDDFQGQRTGYRGLYTDITGGFQFAPTARITIRPELRFDHNSLSRPFENKPNLFTAASDVIVHW